MLQLKYLNPLNYFKYVMYRLIALRIRYGAPMKVTAYALSEKINFIVSSYKEYWMRAKLSYTAEKSTMNWIENHIGNNDTVYDIGANVGAYSLLIGRKMLSGDGVLYSFEPESSNYYSLNRNIIANQLSNKVKAFCLGFDKSLGAEQFFVSSTVPGSATHSLGKAESEGVAFAPKHVQGIIAMSLDEFVELEGVSFPNHIKIDVDGNEGIIVNNAKKTLSDSRLKTLVIEISENVSHGEIERAITELGFSEVEKEIWPGTTHGQITNTLYTK